MTATTGSQPRQSHDGIERDAAARELTNLEVRYGKIGISAVAAALLYCGATKNPAPVAPQPDERFTEVAV